MRVWYAPDRMMAGEMIRRQLDRGLGTYDKLVLVLSEHSLTSDWVRYEIETAQKPGELTGDNVLAPISLIEPARLMDGSLIDADTDPELAEVVRDRLIPDFSDWTDKQSFDRSFAQLHRALQRLAQ